MVRATFLALVVSVSLCAPAAAQECLSTDPPPVTEPPRPLTFGITPGAAGTVGGAQGVVRPRNEAALTQALLDLRPPGRELVLHLNRLFWADGDAGIARFAEQVDAYARAGLRSDIQVRYHPPEGGEGDIDGFERFVRRAVRELGRRGAVVGFSVTNEGNFDGSENTSDGAYEGVVDALVRGVAAAREELRALGRPDLPVGFNVMWRWLPDRDAAFWREIGAKATPAFRDALTYVGVQAYPGLVWPPVPLPGRSAGMELVEALTLIRSCYMPMAGLGEDVALWVSENGYATNLGRDEAGQASALASTLADVGAWSGELGVTDYRYFNLRDNYSQGTDFFAAVGLLRDDHSRKPAFDVMRRAVEAGAPAPDELRARRRSRRRVSVRGSLGAPCADRVVVRLRRRGRTVGRRSVAVRDCAFRVTVRGRRRAKRVVVRHGDERLRTRVRPN